jgi:hypothetical protein
MYSITLLNSHITCKQIQHVNIFCSIVGAVFPLFTSQMCHDLGIHWASSIPVFMTLVCMPFSLVMYQYAAHLHMECK